MIQPAIVGKQQQAGRILIKPSNRLNPPFQEGDWQKRINTGMVNRPPGAFKLWRLVQSQGRTFTIGPGNPIHRENQPRCFHVSPRIITNLVIDSDPALTNQTPTRFTATESLAMKNTFNFHGG